MVQKRAGPYKIPINTWEGMMKIEKKKISIWEKPHSCFTQGVNGCYN